MKLYDDAAAVGIQTEFYDGQGHHHRVQPEALKAILAAMPALPAATSDGPRAEGATGDLPAAPARGPARAFAGDFGRVWLLAVQLYSLRSGHDWGIGDFGDLKRLIDVAAEWGAAGIGLNPLHALFDDRPGHSSPYSPNSRLFLNTLYIDLEAIPEYAAAADRPDRAALAAARGGALMDYAGVAAIKSRALRDAFAAFRRDASAERRQALADFCTERGALLSRFACFEAMRHKLGRPWWEWPEEWQRPDDARCAALRAGPDGDEVAFVEFAQWIADEQLAACRTRASERGMAVGLYLDVAVGVQSDGFDAWNEQVAISRHLAVGAPPDQLNTAGQDWGLAGFNGPGLEARSFAPFRDMLRASMRHAGAIRLDHVLGLQRLYVVPRGFSARDGAYVKMPFEALLAVTADESVAHRCVVIGEDLGTVPDGFRDALASRGIWSYRVMMFERGHHGEFFGPDHYAADALVTFNTHDLPTFVAWRAGDDIHLRRSLGHDPGESDDARRHAHRMFSEALRHQGIDGDDFLAAIRFLAKTPSRLLALSLEDLLGVAEQINVPGTVDEHPNWRRRLPVLIENLAAAVDGGALRAALAGRIGQ